jgi:predicted nucleic acid-binding Zn ribbon protein
MQVKSLGDGRYECMACGAIFAVGKTGDAPRTTIVANGKSVRRVIEAGGKEVHQCTAGATGRAASADRASRHED